MKRFFAALFICLTTGLMWRWAGLQLFFISSGAQNILGNSAHQSSKFINAFIAEPLPRMAIDSSVLTWGLFVVGFLLAIAFLIVNTYLKGGWLKRGLVFGMVHWLVMTPWFEFYLPYNVMLEPLMLVLLEAFLWLCVALVLGLYMSFVVNYIFRSQR